MSDLRDKPTLIVFTLGAHAERTRKRLLPHGCGDLEIGLRRACLAVAIEAGEETGCRVMISSPGTSERLGIDRLARETSAEIRCTTQSGRDFGARLERAMGSAFEGAHEPVVVVGTDVPELTAEHVDRALELLREEPDRVVAGPSPDGGFYLLATARPIEGLATGVSWCCDRTLATLRDLLHGTGRELVLLDPLADLDGPADLERWVARAPTMYRDRPHRWHRLVGMIRRCLARLRRPPLVPGLQVIPDPAVSSRRARAPPATLPA